MFEVTIINGVSHFWKGSVRTNNTGVIARKVVESRGITADQAGNFFLKIF